jgi:predicted nucleotidyltransferase
MNPEATIGCIAEYLRDKPGIRALYLSGSHGAGLADAWSDIDFVAVVPEDALNGFPEVWRPAVDLLGKPVLWRVRPGSSVLINAITPDWLRIDVLAIPESHFATKSGKTVLFDHDGLLERRPETSGSGRKDDARLRWEFEEFIRILGLLPVAMGREEYLNAVTGIFHLRNLLIDLLIEETGAPHRGGALHLNRLIAPVQKDLLGGLSVPEPTRDSAIAAHLAYAAVYLPRARRLAEDRGIDWPESFEQATWAHLKSELAIEPPHAAS